MKHAILSLCLMLTACGTRIADVAPPTPGAVADAVPAVVVPAAPTVPVIKSVVSNTPVEDAKVKEVNQRVAALEGELAKARAEQKQALIEREEAKQEAALAPIRATVVWATWIGVLMGIAGSLLFIATYFWSIPLGRSTIGALAGGGFIVAALAQGVGSALPYFPIIGVAMLVVGALIGLFFAAKKGVTAIHQAARFGDAMERMDPDNLLAIAQAKVAAATQQAEAGVFKLIDRVRSI